MEFKFIRSLLSFERKVVLLNSSQLISYSLDFIEKELAVSCVSIALFNKEKGGFEFLDVRSKHAVFKKGHFIPFSDTVLTEIVRSSQPVYRPDIRVEKTQYAEDELLLQAGIRSTFFIPLIVGGTCLGSLNIASAEIDGIGSNDREFILFLASRTALAIQNNQLLIKLHNNRHDVGRLVEEQTKGLLNINKKLLLEISKNKLEQSRGLDLSLFPEMNPAPVLKVDTNGKIILFNNAAKKLFKKKNLTGKLWEDISPESCKSNCLIQSKSSSRDMCQHEARIGNKHFLFTCQKLPDGDFTIIYGANITKRKQTEKLLQKAHDSLESQVKSRTLELEEAKDGLQNALIQVEQLKNRLHEENIYLQEEIKLNHNFEEIIGHSNAIKNVLGKVELVAATDATVLITGETGTGKELFARAIHNLSPRNSRPLVKVNCAVLQPTLIESELFGHEKGSFTGAFSKKKGRFELANDGALFLDEIGDLTFDLQSKLLRVIQEKEFERLGGTKTIKVDVRIIAATHKDLKEEVKAGRFREDLYYRLNVFPIHLPPLRERRADTPILVKHFVNKYSSALRKDIKNIPKAIIDTLLASPWPGNVRELENIIERAVIFTNSATLQMEGLTVETLTSEDDHATSAAPPPSMTLDELQRNHIVTTLKATNWRIEGEKGAALKLGINASTLRSRIKKLNISRP